jgi:hypothetical protein
MRGWMQAGFEDGILAAPAAEIDQALSLGSRGAEGKALLSPRSLAPRLQFSEQSPFPICPYSGLNLGPRG